MSIPWEPEDSKGTALAFFDDYAKEMLECAGQISFEPIDTNCVMANIISFAFCPYAKSLMDSPFENIKKTMIKLSKERMAIVNFDMVLGVDGLLFQTAEFGSSLLEAMECPSHMVKTLDRVLGETLNRDDNTDIIILQFVSECFSRIKDYFKEYYPYFRNMNSEQFEELVNIYLASMQNILHSYSTHHLYRTMECAIRSLIDIYGPKNIKSYMSYVYNDISEIGKTENASEARVMMMFSDYVKICGKLLYMDRNFEKPKWKFKSVEELKRCHDEVSFIYNMKTNEEEMKGYVDGFNAVKDNWNDMLYAEDEFSVVAPKTPMDIANEGICLNHCVKSYLDNVIAGKTNILFVRKSNDLEKPFYTLEVKKNRIRQCHGFGNCNVSEADGLREFLERYCEEKHIEFESTDRVLAAGY